MRLWTVHPRYLDAKGLGAVWREGLLALKVLRGRTRGYRHHPQLTRFRAHPEPVAAVAAYLREVLAESRQRGYAFAGEKIRGCGRTRRKIAETRGQLLHEWRHLLRKLRRRSPARYRDYQSAQAPQPHPLFRIVPGKVRGWEKTP